MNQTQETIPAFDPRTALARTSEIASAYVARNSIPAAGLPDLITSIHSTLTSLATGAHPAPGETKTAHASPAAIRRSITDDGIVSFLDGRSYKTLRRHLTKNGMTPRSYAAHFGLPHDYPMVAPSYSRRRSELAKALGLGAPGVTPRAVKRPKAAPSARGAKAA